MSRSPNPLTSFSLWEDRLTALLSRIDTAAGALDEQAARELAAGNSSDSAVRQTGNEVRAQLQQLAQWFERHDTAARAGEEGTRDWLAPLQEQLSRIEQRVEELSNLPTRPATFG